MKHLIALLVAMTISCSCCIIAQTRTAYLDLYQRGGARHLRTTLIFDNKPVYIGKTNLGAMLNKLAESGWETDRTINIRRSLWSSPFTRHKFHIILKKEYTEGENPFDGLASSGTRDYNSYSQTRKDVQAEKSTTYASHEIENDIHESIIPANAYQYREDITKFTIPENVKSIGTAAFYKCSNLTVLIIPQSVTKISPYAFGACKRLNEIYCKSPVPPAISPITFQGLSKSAVIYVPAAATEEYRMAQRWEKYADRIMPFNY